MLSRELENTLNQAFKGAREKRHETMTTEHLLLNLLENSAAFDVLIACGADVDELRKNLEEFLEANTPVIPKADSTQETQPTLGFQRVLQHAVFDVQSSGLKEVTGAHVLVGIFGEQESHTVTLLKQQHINRIDVVKYLEENSEEIFDSAHTQNRDGASNSNINFEKWHKEHLEKHEELIRSHRAEHPWQFRLGNLHNYMVLVNPFLLTASACVLVLSIPSVGTFILVLGSVLALATHIRQRFFKIFSIASSADSEMAKTKRDRQTLISTAWAILQQIGMLGVIVGIVVIAVSTYS